MISWLLRAINRGGAAALGGVGVVRADGTPWPLAKPLMRWRYRALAEAHTDQILSEQLGCPRTRRTRRQAHDAANRLRPAVPTCYDRLGGSHMSGIRRREFITLSRRRSCDMADSGTGAAAGP